MIKYIDEQKHYAICECESCDGDYILHREQVKPIVRCPDCNSVNECIMTPQQSKQLYGYNPANELSEEILELLKEL